MDTDVVTVLVAGASDRVTTGRGVLRRWSNEGVGEAARRYMLAAGSSQAPQEGPASAAAAAPVVTEIVEQWWVDWPSRLRIETDHDQFPALRIVDGLEWWSVERSGKVRGSIGYAKAYLYRGALPDMLDPSGMIGAVTFVAANETTCVAHPGVAVEAHPRRTMRQLALPRPEILVRYADYYRIVFHADLGVVLRAESLLDGAVIQLVELVDAVFGESVEDDLLRYHPEPGVTVEPAPDATGRLADGTVVDRR